MPAGRSPESSAQYPCLGLVGRWRGSVPPIGSPLLMAWGSLLPRGASTVKSVSMAQKRIVWVGAFACMLLCGHQASGQSSTIVHTLVRNPNPIGIFTNEYGAPVHNNGP